MQRLIISNKYPEDFVYNYLPELFKQLAAKKILLYRKSSINSYLEKNYNIKITDLIKYLNYIKINSYKNMYIIHMDVDEKLQDGTLVRELFHLISYGNREVRGCHIIDNSFDFIGGNLKYIYRLYTFNKTRMALEEKKKKQRKGLNNGDKIL